MTEWDCFKGPVLDGPWKGNIIHADAPQIDYINSIGHYSYSKVARGWYWIANEQNVSDGGK